jgi:hypothetical protein
MRDRARILGARGREGGSLRGGMCACAGRSSEMVQCLRALRSVNPFFATFPLKKIWRLKRRGMTCDFLPSAGENVSYLGSALICGPDGFAGNGGSMAATAAPVFARARNRILIASADASFRKRVMKDPLYAVSLSEEGNRRCAGVSEAAAVSF